MRSRNHRLNPLKAKAVFAALNSLAGILSQGWEKQCIHILFYFTTIIIYANVQTISSLTSTLMMTPPHPNVLLPCRRPMLSVPLTQESVVSLTWSGERCLGNWCLPCSWVAATRGFAVDRVRHWPLHQSRSLPCWPQLRVSALNCLGREKERRN